MLGTGALTVVISLRDSNVEGANKIHLFCVHCDPGSIKTHKHAYISVGNLTFLATAQLAVTCMFIC